MKTVDILSLSSYNSTIHLLETKQDNRRRRMKKSNKIMLITYADSLGSNLKDLNYVVDTYLKNVIYGIHILPFYPSSADRGFAPTTYEEVDSAFGTWDDLKELSENYDLMYDFMINHISRSSHYFQDFIQKGNASDYKDLFIKYSEFWEKGYPTEEQVGQIYKRKPRAPYVDVTFDDGTTDKIWCTFDEEQIDLDVTKTFTLEFIKQNLKNLCEHGAAIIRLDAFAYAVKKEGTNCFFVEPDMWTLLDYCRDILKECNVELLPEIHEHYTIQKQIEEHNYYVYDFALPMLVLHGLYSGTSQRLIHWLEICPRKQYTTLDTHDGIGVVDVKDLLTDVEIEETRENLYSKGANVKKIYSTTAYNNLDIYQINCTYYSALGNDDNAYLLARAIQFFTPGIPQVYYVGLFAGSNDIELLESTKQGRNINRHYYTLDEIAEEVKRPVVKQLFQLMTFRNRYPAFDGAMTINKQLEEHLLEIQWTKEDSSTILHADLKEHRFDIKYVDTVTKKWTVLDIE